jgi:hypothetical protein
MFLEKLESLYALDLDNMQVEYSKALSSARALDGFIVHMALLGDLRGNSLHKVDVSIAIQLQGRPNNVTVWSALCPLPLFCTVFALGAIPPSLFDFCFLTFTSCFQRHRTMLPECLQCDLAKTDFLSTKQGGRWKPRFLTR